MNKYGLPNSLIFAITSIFCVLAVPAHAGDDTWTVAGYLSGGIVLKTAVNPVTPSILYACAEGGTYKSIDSGNNWTLVLPQYNAPLDVSIEPENPDIVYVATETNAGIEISTDGGNTWSEINDGIETVPAFGGAKDSISKISTDPVAGGTAYAASLNTGIYKTTNYGQSWTSINNGLTSLISSQATFGEVAIDPVNTQVLYIPVYFIGDPSNSADGVYKSTDGGANWSPSKTGIAVVTQVLIDPNDHNHIYVVADYRIYTSTDSGASWTALGSPPVGITLLRINPKDSHNLIASTDSGLYISNDGGATWTSGGNYPFLYIDDIAFDPVTPSNVYVSTYKGIYKSTDGGQTIDESDSGLHSVTDISSMVLGSDSVMYIGSGVGLFKSTDFGVHWNSINNGITTRDGLIVLDLVEDPKNSTTLFAGTVAGLFKTTDGGSIWNLLDNGKANPYTFAVALDPENTQTVYAGTNPDGIFKSTDGGNTWQPMSTGLPSDPIHSLLVDPSNSNIVYAGTESNGIYKSIDGGKTWNADSSGLPTAAEILSIKINPNNDKIIYISCYTDANSGIFKSSDGGNTWSSVNDGIEISSRFNQLLMNPANSSMLYAVPGGPFVDTYVTTDGGIYWQPFTPLGLPAAPLSVGLFTITVDPLHPANLYAAGTDGQIYAFTSIQPTASDNNVLVSQDTAFNGKLIGELENFSSELHFSIVTQPINGTVIITDQSSGDFTYMPNSGFLGQDSFTFVVSAGGAVSNSATETITVNAPPPTSNDDSLTTIENQSVSGTLSASGIGTLQFTIVSQPEHGTVTLSNNKTGAFTYTPTSGYNGTDSFTFIVSNSSGQSVTSTENLTVTVPANTGANGSGSGSGGFSILGLLVLISLGLNRMMRPYH